MLDRGRGGGVIPGVDAFPPLRTKTFAIRHEEKQDRMRDLKHNRSADPCTDARDWKQTDPILG